MNTPAIRSNLKNFLGTGNPIYAWQAYKYARGSGEPIPEAVLAYLDTVAQNISEMARKTTSDYKKKKPPSDYKKRPKELAQALQIGAKNFTDYARNRRYARFERMLEESYCEWIDKYATPDGRTTLHGWENSVLPDLSKQHGISKSTGKRLFDKFLERQKNTNKQ